MEQKTREKIEAVIGRHKQMIAEFEKSGTQVIVRIAEALIKSIKSGGRVYICGNGGSAADAQHIASELVNRFEKERKALPATALTTDTSLITSIANDDSYEKIFTRQVEALVKKDDILWAISTSGSSSNVVAAAELAKEKGATVIAFTGKTGSELERAADICFCAQDESTARSQEIHTIAYHIICQIVEESFS